MNETEKIIETEKRKHYFRLHTGIFRENPALWRSRAGFALCVPVSYLMVEILNENNPFTDLEAWQVAWNLVWYSFLLTLSWLIFRKRRAAACSTAVFSFTVGVMNHFVLELRGKTIFPSDIMSWRTAANVASGYIFKPDSYIYGAAAILAAYLVLLAILKKEKGKKRLPPKLALFWSGGWLAFLVAFFCTGLLPYFNIYAQQWNTQNNGFVFNFMVSLRYSFVDEPEGYSEDAVEEIQAEVTDNLDQTGAAAGVSAGVQPVNMIVIMNESFSDLSIYPGYEASADPLEFYHSLTENTVKGYMYSPVEGGGTATVEFEYLTGDSASFLPEGTVAYQIYIDRYTPTLVAAMNALGYESWAFHPYLPSGWNRPVVYDLFGFAHQLYVNDLTNPEYVRHYVSDACDYETVQSITEAAGGAKTFVFNVTMQNHSGYSQGWNNLEDAVSFTGETVSDEDFDLDYADQYLSLMDASDEAIEALIGYYSQVDEPTLITFFGDHQPAMDNSFYEALYGKSMDELTDEEALTQYETPFFIWANYDIEEREDIRISASFLSVLTMEAANLPLTGYMALLKEVMAELPVVHRIGCLTADGTFVSDPEQLTEDQQALLEDYEYSSYYHLFDRDEEGSSFYELPAA